MNWLIMQLSCNWLRPDNCGLSLSCLHQVAVHECTWQTDSTCPAPAGTSFVLAHRQYLCRHPQLRTVIAAASCQLCNALNTAQH